MRSTKLLTSFTRYCEKYPDLRFWQALVNWCEKNVFIEEFLNEHQKTLEDVFYRTKK